MQGKQTFRTPRHGLTDRRSKADFFKWGGGATKVEPSEQQLSSSPTLVLKERATLPAQTHPRLGVREPLPPPPLPPPPPSTSQRPTSGRPIANDVALTQDAKHEPDPGGRVQGRRVLGWLGHQGDAQAQHRSVPLSPPTPPPRPTPPHYCVVRRKALPGLGLTGAASGRIGRMVSRSPVMLSQPALVTRELEHESPATPFRFGAVAQEDHGTFH